MIDIKNLFKKIIWTIIYPFFPIGRFISVKLGYNPYPPRQPFLLGKLNPNKNFQEFKKYLLEQGFKKNIVAWIDNGEILSVRLLDTFKYQYHIRLFADGEIRGHHELTPEYSPFGHLHDKETSERKKEFKNILNDWLVPN